MDTLVPSEIEFFDTLRAENEAAWLAQVFIPPPGFESMLGMRSIIAFGKEGSGKTTVRLALMESARKNLKDAAPLIVEWQPGLQQEQDENVFVASFLNEIFDLTAQSLGFHLARQPQRYTQASRWAQEGMVWLLHNYLQMDADLFLLRLEENVKEDGLDCLREIFNRSPRSLLSSSAPYPRQMTEIVQTLKTSGFSGLWVMIDGLETWLTLESTKLGKMLTALFSMLALFDIPGFAVKVMAPLQLRSLVSTSTGLTRRRFDLFELDWPKERLRMLCERRLGAIFNRETFSIESLTEDPSLLFWLEKYAGDTPRGWLEHLRVFLNAFLAQPARQPLKSEIVHELYRRYPPRLRMDASGRYAYLGYYPLVSLSSSSLAILSYLYRHPERACSKEELYYRGLRGLDQEPRRPGDPGWEAPKDVEGVMDTAIWRLRQTLEPDPKQPIYIVSERGKGIIRLENAW